MNINLSIFLNASRWIAAFVVVITHVRHLVLVDFKDVQQPTLFTKGVYFVTGFGHEAVVIFFVISGFLVGGHTLDKWRKGRPDMRSYATARVSRIYTVLVPALILGLTLDLMGLAWFNSSELYTNSAQYHTISLNLKISAAMDMPTFFGNLFMLQEIVTGVLGSNTPLWSLSYEWWYYCLFALLAASFMGKGGVGMRILCGVLACALAFALPSKILLWAAIWVMGMLAYAWINASKGRLHPAFGLSFFVCTLIASRLSHNVDNVAHHESLLMEFARDCMVGMGFVSALVSASRITARLPFERAHRWLADFSFSVYLLHFPAMLFMAAVGYQSLGLRFFVQPGLASLFYAASITAVLYLYCFLFSQLTERHTGYVRSRLDALTTKPLASKSL